MKDFSHLDISKAWEGVLDVFGEDVRGCFADFAKVCSEANGDLELSPLGVPEVALKIVYDEIHAGKRGLVARMPFAEALESELESFMADMAINGTAEAIRVMVYAYLSARRVARNGN